MNKYILVLLLSICSISEAATIQGKILPVAIGEEYSLTLINYDTRKDSIVKKFRTDEMGNFSVTIDNTEALIYSLSNEKKAFLHLLIRSKDQIDLQIDGEKLKAKGSQDTQYLIDYENFRKSVFKKWLQPVYDSSALAEKMGNKRKLEYWNKMQTTASDNYKAEISNWVKQPFFMRSPAAIHHSLRWHPDNDISLMDSLVAKYQKYYPYSVLTQQIAAKVTRIKRTAMNAVAPNFISKDNFGNVFQLDSSSDNYILLDFWASWCPPCRQESPTLVRLYNAFKDKKFTIVSISVDDNKEKWLAAIQKDGLVWPNISDLDGWKSPTATLYNVSAIPNSFLLNKEGKIIAKNLRGKDLEDKLVELMGR